MTMKPERNNRIPSKETRALELFRQLSPAQKKVALLSVVLSSFATEAALDGKETTT